MSPVTAKRSNALSLASSSVGDIVYADYPIPPPKAAPKTPSSTPKISRAQWILKKLSEANPHDPDYIAESKRELSSIKPGILLYKSQSKNKFIRIATLVLLYLSIVGAIFLFVRWLASRQMLPVSLKKSHEIFGAASLSKMRSDLVEESNPDGFVYKRGTIQVDNMSIDVMIIGRKETINNGQWVLGSVYGSHSPYEIHIGKRAIKVEKNKRGIPILTREGRTVPIYQRQAESPLRLDWRGYPVPFYLRKKPNEDAYEATENPSEAVKIDEIPEEARLWIQSDSEGRVLAPEDNGSDTPIFDDHGKVVIRYKRQTESPLILGDEGRAVAQQQFDDQGRPILRSSFREFLKHSGFNAVVFNPPNVGASKTGVLNTLSVKNMTNATRAVLRFLEDKKKGIGASKIILYGYCMGGAINSHMLLKHRLKPKIQYLGIQNKCFGSRLSTILAELTKDGKNVYSRFKRSILRLTGWDIEPVKASEKNQDIIPEIIIQGNAENIPKIRYGSTEPDYHYIEIGKHPNGTPMTPEKTKAQLIKELGDSEGAIFPSDHSLAWRAFEKRLRNKTILVCHEHHDRGITNPRELAAKIQFI